MSTDPIIVCVRLSSAVKKPSSISRAKVQVNAPFAFVKARNNPAACIESPIDISPLIGPIYPDQYDPLKDKIVDIVNNFFRY